MRFVREACEVHCVLRAQLLAAVGVVSLTRFNSEDWHELGSWPLRVLGPEYWFGKAFSDEFAKFYGERPRCLLFFDGKQNHQFFSKQTVALIAKRFKANPAAFFNELRKRFNENREALLAREKKIDALGEKQKTVFFEEELVPLFARNSVFVWTAFLFEQLRGDEIRGEYERVRGAEAAVKELPLLVTAAATPQTAREQIALHREALRVKEGKTSAAAAAAAESLAREFGYLTIAYMNEPRDAAFYENALRETARRAERSRAEIESEIAKLESAAAETARRQKRLLEEISLPAELEGEVEALKICGEMRTASDEVVCETGLVLRKTFKPFADALAIPYKNLFFLKTRELIEAKEKNYVDLDLVAEREKFFAAFTNEQESFDLKIVGGEKARELVAAFIENEKQEADFEGVNEFTGIAASAGKARGRVKKIESGINASNTREFKEGEILVAPITMVDFVPLMRKAAAIVTDQGGLTSHAAIVARELGKPCVVGTRVATRVLRDGDNVIVDADAGLVKIEKRKK